MRKPPSPTAKKRGKGAALAAWIEKTRPSRIGEAEFRELLRVLAPISESYLRRLLRNMSIDLAPTVEGVRQRTLDELEASLSALLDAYEQGDPDRRSTARNLVITAKDHARWSARRSTEKEEMILWMLTWLENPPVFRDWVKLRRRQLGSNDPQP